MKIQDMCEQFNAMEIKEIAVNPFISVYTEKHEITAFFYYPNIKKLSIYLLSNDTFNVLDENSEYLIKVVHHLPITSEDIAEVENVKYPF
jgi:hypothetical protein